MTQLFFSCMILRILTSVTLSCSFLFFSVYTGFFYIFKIFKLFSELVKAPLSDRFYIYING